MQTRELLFCSWSFLKPAINVRCVICRWRNTSPTLMKHTKPWTVNSTTNFPICTIPASLCALTSSPVLPRPKSRFTMSFPRCVERPCRLFAGNEQTASDLRLDLGEKQFAVNLQLPHLLTMIGAIIFHSLGFPRGIEKVLNCEIGFQDLEKVLDLAKRCIKYWHSMEILNPAICLFKFCSLSLMTTLQMFFPLCSMNKILEKWR